MKQIVNGQLVDMTQSEIDEYNARNTAWNNASATRKLAQIKQIRLEKLQETDWWVLRGDITDEQKLYRKNLRDIPTNHTDENAYDLLLARDSDGNLTHTIWESK